MLGDRPDEGSASSIGLIIAAATFMGAFVFAEMMVAEPGGMDPRPQALENQAGTALDLIVQQAGQGLASDWAANPDTMQRFGLSKEGQPNFLDYVKIKSLRNGTMTITTNNAPDYPEAKIALGITSGDFHLRSYPVLPTLQDPRWTKENDGRIAYMGHHTGAVAPVNITINTTLVASKLNVTVTLKNVAAFPATYDAKIGIGQRSANRVVAEEDRNTRLLQPGETQTVWVTFDALAWGEQSGQNQGQNVDLPVDGVRVDVSDPYQNPAVDENGVRVGPKWLTVAPPIGTVTLGYLISADQQYVPAGSPVNFTMDRYDRGGKQVAGSGRFVLVGPNGKEWVNQSVSWPLATTKAYRYACPNCTTTGIYTAIASDASGGRREWDMVWVNPTPLFTEKVIPDALATKEISLISQLSDNFGTATYNGTSNTAGDVFIDDSNAGRDLASLLETGTRYSTLIIGSEVSQNALTPNAVKWAIASWVQDGGNLIVLGTNTQQSNWLQPIYQAAQINANGGITAPDITNPILIAPEHLDYQRYLDRGRAWSIDQDQPFTHVLTRGILGSARDDTLAYANAGALGNGTVVLTTYMPGALVQPQDDMEAKRFLHNLLSQSYTMLYLDYGPPIPDGIPVGSAQRLVAIEHPNVPGAVVETKLVFYRFDGT